MARQPKNTPVPQDDSTIDTEKFKGAMEAMRADAAATATALTEQSARVSALALQLNYNGSTDPAVLENSAKDAIRRIGMAVFELGGYLLLLRENAPHGAFLPALERLGLAPRAAQQYMSVTRRFAANANSSSHLLENFGVKKLVELLVLDDEQLEDLTELGQTGELALDDLGGMSVKELRIAVRKARAEAEKHKARADRQESVNNELHEEVRLIKHLPASEELKRTQRESADIQAEVLGLIQGNLRRALIALNNCDADQTLFMAGMVGQLGAEIAALRDEFNLPEVGGTPEWEKWAKAQEAASSGNAKAKAN
jgi:hypothetical protein